MRRDQKPIAAENRNNLRICVESYYISCSQSILVHGGLPTEGYYNMSTFIFQGILTKNPGLELDDIQALVNIDDHTKGVVKP